MQITSTDSIDPGMLVHLKLHDTITSQDSINHIFIYDNAFSN